MCVVHVQDVTWSLDTVCTAVSTTLIMNKPRDSVLPRDCVCLSYCLKEHAYLKVLSGDEGKDLGRFNVHIQYRR